MDLQDSSDVKDKLRELVDNFITHLAKPQVLSNIVNNVFNPLDCILSKFNTTRTPGGFEFVVRCGNVTALLKIQKSVYDGTLAKQIERAVFTVEVIGEENLTRVSMKTKIDEETYQEAYEKLQKSGKVNEMLTFLLDTLNIGQLFFYDQGTVTPVGAQGGFLGTQP